MFTLFFRKSVGLLALGLILKGMTSAQESPILLARSVSKDPSAHLNLPVGDSIEQETETQKMSSGEKRRYKIQRLLDRFRLESKRSDLSRLKFLPPGYSVEAVRIYLEEKLQELEIPFESVGSEGTPIMEYELPNWVNLTFLSQRIQRLYLKNYDPEILVQKEPDHEVLQLDFKLSPSKGPVLPESVQMRFKKGKAHGRACIIVDDMGHMGNGFPIYLSMGHALTMSFLPFYDTSVPQAKTAWDHGYEIMLHLPMEPNHRFYFRSPYVIETSLQESEVLKRVRKNVSEIPYISGFNNHQGSKATGNEELMELVMGEVSNLRPLYFVDSITAKRSYAYEKARYYGVPAAKRNSDFLDNVKSVSAIEGKIQGLIHNTLRYKGVRIAIMHETKVSAQALKNMLYAFREAGIELVFPSDFLKIPESQSMRSHVHENEKVGQKIEESPLVIPGPINFENPEN